MAAGDQTAISELSLDLSSLRAQEQDEESKVEERLREFSASSSERDDLEELTCKDSPTIRSDSTKLDLTGLSDSGSDCSSGPSLSRDRRRISTLPSVSQRPFLASEAWGGLDSNMEPTNRSRGVSYIKGKEVSRVSRRDQMDDRVPQSGQDSAKFTRGKLPSMPRRVANISVSPQRPSIPSKGVGFGSTYMRDSDSFQRTRLYSRPVGQPRVLPPFLRAHSRDRKLQTVTIQKNTIEPVPKVDESGDVHKPKDFATLHLLARRSQGHLRYRYMAMINEWIAEHGMPNS